MFSECADYFEIEGLKTYYQNSNKLKQFFFPSELARVLSDEASSPLENFKLANTTYFRLIIAIFNFFSSSNNQLMFFSEPRVKAWSILHHNGLLDGEMAQVNFDAVVSLYEDEPLATTEAENTFAVNERDLRLYQEVKELLDPLNIPHTLITDRNLRLPKLEGLNASCFHLEIEKILEKNHAVMKSSSRWASWYFGYTATQHQNFKNLNQALNLAINAIYSWYAPISSDPKIVAAIDQLLLNHIKTMHRSGLFDDKFLDIYIKHEGPINANKIVGEFVYDSSCDLDSETHSEIASDLNDTPEYELVAEEEPAFLVNVLVAYQLRALGIEDDMEGQYMTRVALHKAYRKAALKTHPDKTNSTDTNDFIEVSTAYKYILGEIDPNESLAEKNLRRITEIKRQRQDIRKKWVLLTKEYERLNEERPQLEKIMEELKQTWKDERQATEEHIRQEDATQGRNSFGFYAKSQENDQSEELDDSSIDSLGDDNLPK